MTRLSPHITIMMNAKAGSQKRATIAHLRSYLQKAGLTLSCRQPRSAAQSTALARSISQSTRPQIIVAAGGDGTIAAIAAGLIGTTTPLAVLPMGTANVFARELGISNDPQKNARLIENGHTTEIWPAFAEFYAQKTEPSKRLILQMIGVGPDAYCVYHVSSQVKKYIGRFAYPLSALKAVRHYPFQHALTISTQEHSYHASSVIISKGLFYGGPFKIAPYSCQWQRDFHVTLFQERRGLDWFKRLAQIGTSQGGIKSFRASKLWVSAPTPRAVQSDGDFCGFTPFSVNLAHKPLYVLTPSPRGY